MPGDCDITKQLCSVFSIPIQGMLKNLFIFSQWQAIQGDCYITKQLFALFRIQWMLKTHSIFSQ